MKPSAIPAFLVALLASALVWGLSPLITGHLEPWDADGLYYVGALTVTGIVTGGLFPRPLWAHYLGSVVGQLTYELIFLKLGPLFLLGFVFTSHGQRSNPGSRADALRASLTANG